MKNVLKRLSLNNSKNSRNDLVEVLRKQMQFNYKSNIEMIIGIVKFVILAPISYLSPDEYETNTRITNFTIPILFYRLSRKRRETLSIIN